MAYFSVKMGDIRPTSFDIADGVEFQRGALLFLDATSGKATPKEDGNEVLGFTGDNHSSSVVEAVLNESLTATATTDGTGAFTSNISFQASKRPVVIPEGATVGDPGTGTDLFVAGSSITLTISDGTTTTSISDTNGTVTLADATNGVFKAQISGTYSASTTYTVTLTISYQAVTTNTLGYTTALDISANSTTTASGKATIYFLPGIYETDQFDPYVAYNVGDKVYAKDQTTSGLITTDSSSGKEIGLVVKAPAAAYTAEGLTVHGHENPVPNSVRVLFRP